MAASLKKFVSVMVSVAILVVAEGICNHGSCMEKMQGHGASDVIDLLQTRAEQRKVSVQSQSGVRTRSASEIVALAFSRLTDTGLGASGATTSIEGLTKSMGQLAADVVAGKTDLTSITREALNEIRHYMESVFSAATTGHTEDQGEVDRAEDAIEACADYTTGFQDFADSAESKRVAHTTCRTGEAALKVDMDAKYAIYSDLVENPGAPQCMTHFATLATMHTVSELFACVSAIAAWAPAFKINLTRDKGAFDAANTAHAAKLQLCVSDQESYEGSFCSYHQELTEKCTPDTGLYAECRASTIALQVTTNASVLVAETSRKAEYQAGKHILCFLGVLNASKDEQKGLLDGCTTATSADTSAFDIVYPGVPAEATCDLTPVASKPCDTLWIDAYTGAPWYENAPAATCTTCPSATQAPTPAPTANPTALPTAAPTEAPTPAPTANPTALPTAAPTEATPYTLMGDGSCWDASNKHAAGIKYVNEIDNSPLTCYDACVREYGANCTGFDTRGKCLIYTTNGDESKRIVKAKGEHGGILCYAVAQA